MLIRTEAPADILFIKQLLSSIFSSSEEVSLVTTLRENGRRTLSLVACTDEGEKIGYIMFSPLIVNGEDSHWQVISLVCIDEQYRGQGLATQLVKEGLNSLIEFGYPGCVVADNSSFWQKLGFRHVTLDFSKKLQIFSFNEQPFPQGDLSFGDEFDGLALAQMR
ncbi:GNAT family N-acetyltransferase [Vibrio palustris]|uniref:Acetyltransferase (GNAT) family protein n=1 Tax=Vibrio palustris TaxID=1918946 RepID=A0A1R4B8Q7_9VIBR|nr:N-acetyltransferase [Vibrio palustris]SJL85313.1 Acetyltransferase (GNAT) family protein [Vibrio palustris]